MLLSTICLRIGTLPNKDTAMSVLKTSSQCIKQHSASLPMHCAPAHVFRACTKELHPHLLVSWVQLFHCSNQTHKKTLWFFTSAVMLHWVTLCHMVWCHAAECKETHVPSHWKCKEMELAFPLWEALQVRCPRLAVGSLISSQFQYLHISELMACCKEAC